MSEQASADGTLPAPTGPYRVGRAAYSWRDPGQDDPSSRAGAPAREVVAWAWYPAEPEPDARPAAYLPAGWEPVGRSWGFRTDGVVSHAWADAPLAGDRARYPVLIFSPSGFPPLVLAAILEEIASHGYVVVGINHTGESTVTVFPDGRVVPMDAERMQAELGPFSGPPEDTLRARGAIADDKAADIRFVVDRLAAVDAGAPGADVLAGRLDLERLGAFGHSMGGNAALEYCRLDERCRAAANLDGANWNTVGLAGLDRPALLVMSDHAELARPCTDLVAMGAYPSVDWCEAERAITVGGWQTVHERARPGYSLLVKASGHISFMDVPFLALEAGSLMAGGLGAVRIDPRRAWRIVCDCLLAFFGRHLAGTDASILDGPSDGYPELEIGAPRDLLGRGEAG